jgi:diketogulonate reductase-like aldo/keto reductase
MLGQAMRSRWGGIYPLHLSALAQEDDIVPMLGTKKRKYLEENVAALNVRLTKEDLRPY